MPKLRPARRLTAAARLEALPRLSKVSRETEVEHPGGLLNYRRGGTFHVKRSPASYSSSGRNTGSIAEARPFSPQRISTAFIHGSSSAES
jgi:hypothetical protein